MAPRYVSIDAMCTTRGRGNPSVTYAERTRVSGQGQRLGGWSWSVQSTAA